MTLSRGAAFTPTKTARSDAGSLEIGPLAFQDLSEVLALYSEVLLTAQSGFLAEREESEISSILDMPAQSASIGAWTPGNDGAPRRLVAYSLCSLERAFAFPEAPIIAKLQEDGVPIWTGKGTVVAPAFEGRLLMSRLLRARGDLLRERNSWHTAGLIATANIASLTCALRAGGWVVGLQRDAYCQNFVCYAGRLSAHGVGRENLEASVRDDALMRRFISAGWVGVGLGRPGADGHRTLRFAQPSQL